MIILGPKSIKTKSFSAKFRTTIKVKSLKSKLNYKNQIGLCIDISSTFSSG